MAPRILFLDDDPVIRVLRMVLSDAEHDPWIRDYFAPEKVDVSRLARAAKGLRRSDGAVIGLASDGKFEDAAAILFRRGAVNRELLARHPNLKLIQRLGERSQDIDLEAAAERGIRVSCLPRRTLHYTAEHGILLMLALAKRLIASDRAVREGAVAAAGLGDLGGVVYNWAGMDASGLYGKTLGIVGMGEVGLLTARLARAFGMTILYTKRSRATPEQEAATGARFVELRVTEHLQHPGERGIRQSFLLRRHAVQRLFHQYQPWPAGRRGRALRGAESEHDRRRRPGCARPGAAARGRALRRPAKRGPHSSCRRRREERPAGGVRGRDPQLSCGITGRAGAPRGRRGEALVVRVKL